MQPIIKAYTQDSLMNIEDGMVVFQILIYEKISCKKEEIEENNKGGNRKLLRINCLFSFIFKNRNIVD